MSVTPQKIVYAVHNANVDDYMKTNLPNKDQNMCIVCKKIEACIMDHVCGYGRCLDCFDKGSKIYCPYCKPHKYNF